MKKIEKLIGGMAALLMPMMALAATAQETLANVKDILNVFIGVLFVLVTIYFIWGVLGYIFAGGEEKKLEEGKKAAKQMRAKAEKNINKAVEFVIKKFGEMV